MHTHLTIELIEIDMYEIECQQNHERMCYQALCDFIISLNLAQTQKDTILSSIKYMNIITIEI